MKFDLDCGKTALANALDRMALLAAENPQTRFTPPTCLDEDPHWGPLSEDWVKDVGMVKTLGPKQAKPCSHKAETHVHTLTVISDVHPIAGRRGRDGAFHAPRWTRVKCGTNVPKRTLENIAACQALGLAYWSEAPGGNMLYAVDDEQHAHHVRIDRKAQMVEHYCAQTWRYDPVAQTPRHETKKHCTAQRDVRWEVAPTMGALMLSMDPPPAQTDELGATGHCLVGNHHRCAHRIGGPSHGGVTLTDGRVYRCACDCHTTEVPVDQELRDEESGTGLHGRTPGGDLQAGDRADRQTAPPGGDPGKTDREDVMMANSLKLRSKPTTAAQRKAAADKRAKDAAKQAEIKAAVTKASNQALYNAAGEKPMSREQARSLLLHDPDYLGDITNTALVDLLSDESVKKFHPRIRREWKQGRGLTERKSA